MTGSVTGPPQAPPRAATRSPQRRPRGSPTPGTREPAPGGSDSGAGSPASSPPFRGSPHRAGSGRLGGMALAAEIPPLSKSRYLAGRQCSRRVWLACHEPGLAPDPGPALQALFDAGHEVGRRAHALFPNGVLVPEGPGEHAAAVQRTRALLEMEAVPALFEAAFEHAGVRIRVDVLERLGRHRGRVRWGLREVKATTDVKDVHLVDCAVQHWVLEGCGLRVGSVELVHLNREYVRGEGEVEWPACFRRRDLTRAVQAERARVPEHLEAMRRHLTEPTEPEVEPNGHCFEPFECPFWDHCTRDKPDDWIFHLPRARSGALEALRAIGVERIAEIPDDHPLTRTQRRIRDVVRRGRPYVSERLARVVRAAGPPAHYLDFETTAPPIPLYPGTRPYHTVPFQWSLHSDPGWGELVHRDFLGDGKSDPRRAFAETLLAALGSDDAPVLVYSHFERTVLSGLSALFPDLEPGLARLQARLFDLLPVVREHVYHPDFGFGFSLKNVAPALSPGFGWDDLEDVADGGTASAAFAALATGAVPAAYSHRLRLALRTYCARDTRALVELHRALRELAGGAARRLRTA